MTRSVTQRLAEWIVTASYESIPTIGIERVRERVLDSIGVQFGGMSVPTGQVIARWVEAQSAKPECTVVGQQFRTSAAYAALVNGTAGHALEYDDAAMYSGHPANPMTAATLALGEKLGCSGTDMILAWMIGWEVTSATTRICLGPQGNDLINRGWFNQGFQPALGVAALASRLMGFDAAQTRMALGNAASTMAGMFRNRASDTKAFVAGNAAMHGIMAAELAALGFTANDDIIDGDNGVARLLAPSNGDPERVLANLGNWDMASYGSGIKFYAGCSAAHWAMDAMNTIVSRSSFKAGDVEKIDVYFNSFLQSNLPYHAPETGLEAKYSMEYDIAALAIDGAAGMHQYTDAMVRRPEARAMMKRVVLHPIEGDLTQVKLHGRAAVTFKDGRVEDETVEQIYGNPGNPASWERIAAKFAECARGAISEAQQREVIALCAQLDTLDDVSALARAIAART